MKAWLLQDFGLDNLVFGETATPEPKAGELLVKANWEEEVLKLTDGKGVDLLLDVAGGEGINQSIAATKAAGRIAQIGFLTGQTTTLSLMPLIFRQTTIRGIAVAPRSSFDRMNAFLNEHAIEPLIDHVYSFDEAHQAYEHLARGAFGKVVIKVLPLT